MNQPQPDGPRNPRAGPTHPGGIQRFFVSPCEQRGSAGNDQPDFKPFEQDCGRVGRPTGAAGPGYRPSRRHGNLSFVQGGYGYHKRFNDEYDEHHVRACVHSIPQTSTGARYGVTAILGNAKFTLGMLPA